MDLKTHIGIKVKAARQEKGLTQEQLADAISRAVETVSNIERGFALTGLETLQQISAAVDKPMAFFFEDAEHARTATRKRIEAEAKLVALARSLNESELLLAVSLLNAVASQKRP